MSVPNILKYSEALKPVSIPSSVVTRKFTPQTSGPYNTGNNIIRIPINTNSFVDTRNMVLKFRLQQTANVACYLDGSASSVIQRVELTSPDGASLSNIDNYGRLYHALMDVERNQLNRESIGNLMEGCSTDNLKIAIRKTATAGQLQILVNDSVVGTCILGTASEFIRANDFIFGTTATNTDILIGGARITNVNGANAVLAADGTFVTFTIGTTASSATINGVQFRVGTADTLHVDNSPLSVSAAGTTINQVFVTDVYREHTALSQSEIFGNGTSRTYAVPLVMPLTNIKTLYPAMLAGGQGCVLNIYTANQNDQVFFSALRAPANVPIYSVDGVELIAPVVNYPDSVVQALRSTFNNLGSLNMSAIDYQCYPYPYATGQGALSIPVAVRNRSLKSLIFFFQSNQSSANLSVPRTSAREYLNVQQWQLKVGSLMFPASPVQFSSSNPAESIVELMKGFSRLNDIQIGPYLSKDNFFLSQFNGGLQVFAIDLEALGFGEFLEAGLDTITGAPSCFLDLTLASNTTSAGTAYVFAMYDSTISLLSNGNMTMTK
jgi:hypothetical protein